MRRSASAPMLRRASGSYGSLSNLADVALGAFEDDGTALEFAEGEEGEGEAGGAAPATTERKKGVPWSEEEHRLFLVGLQKLGKGNWRGIARGFVHTRTPTQVGSHAQKYFLRQSSASKRGRTSLFDMVAAPAEPEQTPARVTAPRSSRGTPAARAESVPPLLPGAPQLFGGAPSGTSAADLLAQAGVELLPDGDESPEGAVSAQAAIHRMLWQQWLAAGGGEPRGAGFHRGPVELALLHNPLLVRPTPIRLLRIRFGTGHQSPAAAQYLLRALLGQRVTALAPDVHVFGHTHFAYDLRLDGIRYIQPARRPAPTCARTMMQRRPPR